MDAAEQIIKSVTGETVSMKPVGDNGEQQNQPSTDTENGEDEGENGNDNGSDNNNDNNISQQQLSKEEQQKKLEQQQRVAEDVNNNENTDEEVDENKLLKMLGKFGITASSLDELKNPKPVTAPTAEELEKQEEEEQNLIVQFSLKNKIYDSKTLESYGQDKNRSAQDITYELFSAAQKAQDNTLTESQIQDRFNQHFALGEDEEEWRKEYGAKEMENIAQNYISEKYKNVHTAGDIYRDHLRIENDAKEYKKVVEAQFAKQPAELSFKVGEGTYAYKPKPETLSAIKDQLLSANQFNAFGQKVPDAALLEVAIQSAIQTKELGSIVQTIAQSHAAEVLLAHKAGRKGIPVTYDEGTTQEKFETGLPEFAAQIVNNVQNSN